MQAELLCMGPPDAGSCPAASVTVTGAYTDTDIYTDVYTDVTGMENLTGRHRGKRTCRGGGDLNGCRAGRRLDGRGLRMSHAFGIVHGGD